MVRRPVLKLSLREQIVDHLRNDVLCGRLREGDHLNEAALARQFGVSRTPIREAIQQLTYEGLVDGRHHVGARVATCPPDSIRELVVPIRRSVEVFAVKAIFTALTEEDFLAWEAILENMRQACLARDFPSIAENDIAFHRWLVRRAGQADLEAIWSSLLVRVRYHFLDTQNSNYDDPLAIYREHQQIVEIFRAGDLEAAVQALIDNIA